MSQLDKVLFILDNRDLICLYPYFLKKEPHFNVDSILANFDENYYKDNPTKIRIVQEFEDILLDSICTDEQLIELANSREHNSVVRLTAFAALMRRGYKNLEPIVIANYNDTTIISVSNGYYGWDQQVGSLYLNYARQARRRGLITAQDSILNDSLAILAGYKLTTKD